MGIACNTQELHRDFQLFSMFQRHLHNEVISRKMPTFQNAQNVAKPHTHTHTKKATINICLHVCIQVNEMVIPYLLPEHGWKVRIIMCVCVCMCV